MKTKIILLAFLIGLAGQTFAAEAVWLTDYKKALETAKREKKTVLMDFTGSDWCIWCVRLKREVFETSEFAAYAKKHLVLLEIDFPRGKPQSDELRQQNRALQEQFGVEGFPTIILLNSDGKPIGQTGYVPGGPQRFIETIQSFK